MKKRTFKIRFMAFLLSVVSLVTAIPFGATVASAAEYYDGGWALALHDQEVFNEQACTTHKGTVYLLEAVTVLKITGNVAKIEYSTSGGPKQGYVPVSSLYTDLVDNTCVADVTTSTNVYYGNSSSNYTSCGSVSAGERVVVLAKNGNWVYIEYNTTQGRKRGYVLYNKLSCHNRPSYFPDLYTYDTSDDFQTYGAAGWKIFSGPSERYTQVGVIPSTGYYSCYYVFDDPVQSSFEYHYIHYVENGVLKSGFLVVDSY